MSRFSRHVRRAPLAAASPGDGANDIDPAPLRTSPRTARTARARFSPARALPEPCVLTARTVHSLIAGRARCTRAGRHPMTRESTRTRSTNTTEYAHKHRHHPALDARRELYSAAAMMREAACSHALTHVSGRMSSRWVAGWADGRLRSRDRAHAAAHRPHVRSRAPRCFRTRTWGRCRLSPDS